ncbi:helix-turn-helix domain-containing protein [Amycolatopsis acidicola]|uniref:helix-turn-helix domain-containing protein n=1 Tax=Amycolatopsis acidicola TaxID=2596893 RepID=UPI001FB7C270|nr:helix-turn-helix transcriptional regulator [Amycolatopsis acidicola]
MELAVLRDAANGLENIQIANRQFRSVETIRSHLKNIYRKLHARNRTHAVAIAYHIGIFAGRAQEDAPRMRPLSPQRIANPQISGHEGQKHVD